MARPKGSFAMSEWELDEMRALWRAGWKSSSLAALYGTTERTIDRRLRAMGESPRRRSKRI